jgi:pimeloyl-ACP methyl ester carboxylesterase
MINRRVAALLVFIAAPLAACVSGTSGSGDSNPNAGFQARFVPLGGVMPFPNDLYFNGSTTGTLNIPGSATVPQNAPLLALNHLDGFGTESDIDIYFTAPVDKTTLTPANVIVLQVSSDASTKAVTGFVKPLVPGTDYSIALSAGIDSNNQIVTIKPLKPLAPSTVNPTTHVATPSTYLVIVTNGVKDSSGDAVTASSDYSTILAADLPALTKTGVDPTKIAMATTDPLFPVAEFSLGQIAVAAGAGVTPTNIAVTFSFSTAYLNISLGQLAATVAPTTQPTGTGIFTTGKTVCDILVASGQLPNATACALVPGSTDADVYAGDVALPYYLAVPTATNPTAALTDFWKNAKGGDTAISATDATSFLPKATVPQNVIPILVAIPNAGSVCGGTPPGGSWPVAIFQHGITRNREDMLAMASGLAAQACIAVIAIDLPLHGVTDTTDPFYKNQLFKGTAVAAALTAPVSERTFDMDLENNTTLAAGPDGKIDSSGAWFINLTSTITSRDNLREGAADLLNLVATLPNLHAVGAATTSFDSSEVFYVGHSLGGIVGTTFLGADTESGAPKIVAAVLANPGGHIAELLRNSAEFEPIIDGQLAANGLVKGSQAYYDFYSEAQAAVEDGDPANYAAFAVAGHPIHMLEVVGGLNGAADTCNLPDQVVPNTSTDLLASIMGLVQIDSSSAGNKFIVRFLAGDHGSFLSPAVPASCTNNTTNQGIYGAVTVEMQTEMGTFLGSGGTGVTINNTPPIIKAP